MIGTFYRSSSPEISFANALVIKIRDILCIQLKHEIV